MKRSAWTWIAVAAGALALAGGGWWIVANRDTWRAALRGAFSAHGLNPDWGEALGETETELGALGTLNDTGPDGARGGSYGATQISEVTARAYGYQGAMSDLQTDPAAAADLTARMVADGFAERDGNYYWYGRPSTPDEMASVWNSGLLPVDAPASTKRYMAKLGRYLAAIEARNSETVS